MSTSVTTLAHLEAPETTKPKNYEILEPQLKPEDVRTITEVRLVLGTLLSDENNTAGRVFSGAARQMALNEYGNFLRYQAGLFNYEPNTLMATAVSDENPYGRIPFDGRLAENESVRIFRAANGVGVRPKRPTLSPEDLEAGPLSFTSSPTDVMTIVNFDPKRQRWVSQVLPNGELMKNPWATPFHYGDGFITGMLFYQFEDGIYSFRADEHFTRAERDAARLDYPELPAEFLGSLMQEHVRADRRWVPRPNKHGNRYYGRFTVFPNVEAPKLNGPERQAFFLGSPMGPYKVDGNVDKLRIRLMQMERPVVPGLANTKASANYAEAVRSFVPHVLAGNYHESLHVTPEGMAQEGTSSNLVVVQYGKGKDGKNLVLSPDPKISGVLPGITVKSALELADYDGADVRFGVVTLDDVKNADELGMTGTAMGVCEIGRLDGESGTVYQADASMGEVLGSVRDHYNHIQSRTHTDDSLNRWMKRVG